MRVWISGAGGFLGNALASTLSSMNLSVFAMTSGTERLQKQFADHPFVTVCPKNGMEMEGAVKEGDLLINCAYPRNEAAAELAGGFDYTAKLFRIASEHRMPVINISSQSVYSRKREQAATENLPAVLENSYAAGKYLIELLLDAELKSIPHTSIRMASLIGPGFDQRIPNRLIDQVLDGKDLNVREDHQLFGFLDIADAVFGIALLVQTNPEKWKRIYNLGGTKGCSLRMIAETVREVMKEEYGREVNIIYKEDETYTNTTVDSSLLSADTGYTPSVTLKESISKIAAGKVKSR